MSNTIMLKIPESWVSEDGVLFMVSHVYRPLRRIFEDANRALEENGYEVQISDKNFRPPYPKVWVDPAYVMAELWPNSAVSTQKVEGWVGLFMVSVEELEGAHS